MRPEVHTVHDWRNKSPMSSCSSIPLVAAMILVLQEAP